MALRSTCALGLCLSFAATGCAPERLEPAPHEAAPPEAVSTVDRGPEADPDPAREAAPLAAITCALGHYGPQCAPCSCEHGICDDGADGTGQCASCDPGYIGADCSRTATCVFGEADDGVQGSGNCTTCIEGVFGADCDRWCTCSAGTCDDGVFGSGQCAACDDGFYGPNCNQGCTCLNGACNDGPTGTGTCSSCVSGFYGLDCASSCSCTIHGTCADGIMGNGMCACDAGYFGATCRYGVSVVGDMSPLSYALVDLDDDGSYSLAIGQAGGNVAIYRQPQARQFSEAANQVVAVGGDASGLAAAHIDAGGTIDIVVAGADTGGGSPNLVLTNGTGMQRVGALTSNDNVFDQLASSFDAVDVVVGHFDGDAHADMVWTEAGQLRILHGNGTADDWANVTTPATLAAIATTHPPSPHGKPAVADLDGDGDQDLLVFSGDPSNTAYAGEVTLLLNDGTGTFTEAFVGTATIDVDNINALSVAAGDFNGDELTDIAFFNKGEDGGEAAPSIVFGYRTSADGAPPAYVFVARSFSYGDAYGLAAADLGSDYDTLVVAAADAIVTYETLGAVRVPMEAEVITPPGLRDFGALTVVDVDDDDTLDFVVESPDGVVVVWRD